MKARKIIRNVVVLIICAFTTQNAQADSSNPNPLGSSGSFQIQALVNNGCNIAVYANDINLVYNPLSNLNKSRSTTFKINCVKNTSFEVYATSQNVQNNIGILSSLGGFLTYELQGEILFGTNFVDDDYNLFDRSDKLEAVSSSSQTDINVRILVTIPKHQDVEPGYTYTDQVTYHIEW